MTGFSAIALLLGCSPSESQVSAKPYPDMNSEGFRALSMNCAECHALPYPDAHTASEWPAVIAKMQSNRMQRGIGPIPASEMKLLHQYLRTHAAQEAM
ncbi:MAG: hypothetical protein HQM07_05840 [Zetaproteobacteria bacterium]|nr:hypothetical protein [Zetaproteobacteria bacterium]